MTPKILITGASGYLGSVLTRALTAQGLNVSVLDENEFPWEKSGCGRSDFRFYRGQVEDAGTLRKLLRDVDVIFPLAALVGAAICDQNPDRARVVNYESIKLLNRLRSPDQWIVFPMTNAGYVCPAGGEICDEDSPMKPLSLYARTKSDAEKCLLDRGGVISLRMASLVGVSPAMRWDLMVHNFLLTAYREKLLVLYEADAKRNFLHILDAVDCFIFCLSRWNDLKDRPYNLGYDAANLTKIEIAEKIRAFLPDLEISRAGKGSDPDRRDFYISNDRLRQAGFTAKRTLEQGIEEVIGYLKSEKDLCLATLEK
jgi:nucleoside-diphosphate-sugar epimerase